MNEANFAVDALLRGRWTLISPEPSAGLPPIRVTAYRRDDDRWVPTGTIVAHAGLVGELAVDAALRDAEAGSRVVIENAPALVTPLIVLARERGVEVDVAP